MSQNLCTANPIIRARSYYPDRQRDQYTREVSQNKPASYSTSAQINSHTSYSPDVWSAINQSTHRHPSPGTPAQHSLLTYTVRTVRHRNHHDARSRKRLHIHQLGCYAEENTGKVQPSPHPRTSATISK